jgi:hypothetical protein
MATIKDQQKAINAHTLTRIRMDEDLKEFRCAQRMLMHKASLIDEVRWNVIWEGKNVISNRLAARLQRIDGLLGEW